MTRPTFDELGLATAQLWARRSSDPKVKVGACLLDRHHRVVGVGYNGRAAGEPNERESLVQGASGFIHATTGYNKWRKTLRGAGTPKGGTDIGGLHTPKIAGIYAIRQNGTERVYVGSSGDIHKRWREHRSALNAGTHHSSFLQRVWNKHGSDELSWEVVEEVVDLSQLVVREQFYISEFGAYGTAHGMNASPTAGSPRGVKHKTGVVEAMRQRVKAAYTTEAFQQAHRAGQRRRFEDPEQRLAIRKRNSGVYRVTTPEGEVIEVEGITAFCRERGISVTRMTALARGESRADTCKGWKCELIKQSLSGAGKLKEKRPNIPEFGRGHANKKTFIARSPSGAVFKGLGLAAFCNEHGLEESSARNVAARRASHHKGWVIRWADQAMGEADFAIPARKRGNVRTYCLVSPDGAEYRIDNLVAFAKLHGLNSPTLVEVAKGRRTHHKGWGVTYVD